ncbi:MAG TPA: UvrD-helicase domain-containing protein, partial [Microlunatus sp.]|nr:UvrD-helicase domain-containing protein [Microlunatus sp.]
MSRDWTGGLTAAAAVDPAPTGAPPAVDEPAVPGVDPAPFDVCGSLPTGTTVLEASAGTGKTFTIAALAARYVAEGHVELPQLMIVTFGRMATDELRVKVRGRLVGLETQLADVLGLVPPGVAVPAPDLLTRLLLDADRPELVRRHERVTRALADFDAATIATTHEFCLRMLDDLGVLGDPAPDAVFVEHLAELTAEVARDVYLRRYATEPNPVLSFPDAARLAE